MRLPLLLSLAAILSACNPAPPSRTPPAQVHVGATIDLPGATRAFLIPAGSADARIQLLLDAYERDIKMARDVEAEWQNRFQSELSSRRSEIAALAAQVEAEHQEANRLARIYIANQQAAGRSGVRCEAVTPTTHSTPRRRRKAASPPSFSKQIPTISTASTH